MGTDFVSGGQDLVYFSCTAVHHLLETFNLNIIVYPCLSLTSPPFSMRDSLCFLEIYSRSCVHV